MKEARYFYVPQASVQNELPADEAVHALRVLRLASGDEMFLMDGDGGIYRAKVTMTSSKHCFYEIVETLHPGKAWLGNIHLAIAPTKMMERIEWMAEKATEIGFDELSLLKCTFSERKVVNTARLDKIVVSAMKQSRKPFKPVVHEMVDFNTFIQQPRTGRKFIAHCYNEVPRLDLFTLLTADEAAEDCTVLVGPEGDFSIDEVRAAIANGYQSISLGDFRLRTETAGLLAVTMALLSLRK